MRKIDQNLIKSYKEHIDSVKEFKELSKILFEEKELKILIEIFNNFINETQNKITFIESIYKQKSANK